LLGMQHRVITSHQISHWHGQLQCSCGLCSVPIEHRLFGKAKCRGLL
jgi:hypothetical protein